MKNNVVIFDFERYTAPAIYIAIFFILVGTFFAILLREAKEQNSNWSAPVWFANIIILVCSCLFGGLVFQIIKVLTNFTISEGPWYLIPVAILGWMSTFFIHAIVKKIAPVKLKLVALKMFS